MLIISAAFLLITLLYLIIWEPVFNAVEQQSAIQQSQKKVLAWMQNAEKEIGAIRSSGDMLSLQNDNQSINTLVEKSAISAGIRGQIEKIQSDNEQTLKVQFKEVDFNRLTQWLGKLQSNYAITPKNISINNSDSSGLVSCRVTLVKASS